MRMFCQACSTIQAFILMGLVHGALLLADDAAMIALLFC